MLTGMATARIDKWGRVKIPSDMLKSFKEKFGNEVFVTSMYDRNIQIYPLATWHELADNVSKTKKEDALLRNFLMKTNYNGQIVRIDRFRRIQIPGFLRKKIRLDGRIDISLKEDHLELMRS